MTRPKFRTKNLMKSKLQNIIFEDIIKNSTRIFSFSPNI